MAVLCRIYGSNTYSSIYATYDTDGDSEPGKYTSGLYLRNGSVGMEYDASGTETLNIIHGYSGGAASNMYFKFSANTRMTLNDGGHLGLGTTTPNIVGFTGPMLTLNGTGNYQGLEVGTSGTTRMTVVSDGLNGYVSTRQAGMCLIFEAGAASEKMRITSDGKVGVATIAPLKKLNVYGGNGDGIAIGRNCTNAGNYESAVLNFYPSSDTANKRNWSIASYFSADYNLDFLHSHTTTADPYCNLATSVMSLDGNNDRVGIGTSTPSYKLHVNGTFYAAGSSQDYKQSICNYNTDSCMFMKLKPVTYQYKEEYCHLGKELKSGTQIGLIAEEVAESHPELAILVNEEDNKVVRNVDYEKLTIILLSELQKLRQEVDQLKNK